VTLTMRHGIRAVITLAAVGASTALVACGGSQASGEDPQAKAEDAGLAFAKCMREHGVDMPDPQPASGSGGGGGGFNLQFRGGDPRNDSDFQDAQDACGHILQDAIPEGDRPDPAEMQDKLHKMTECLRDKGYDVPEPQIIGPGDTPTAEAKPPSQELQNLMNDPDFQKAQEECSKEADLPGGGPSFQVGPGGGSDSGPSTQSGSDN
jgi:hypothetical protein